MENWLSVAAIEAELKPKVIETFDTIAGTYKRLRRLQDQDIQLQLKRLSLSPAQERNYKKLKKEIIGEVKSLRLNQPRIDALVEQLYDINKRLVGYEGRLMRLAESHGVVREDFLKSYLGSELDPLWLNRVSKLSAKGWKSFVAKDKDKIKQHRHEVHALAGETGLKKSASSARSCRWCKRASARRARPRRRWWSEPAPRYLDRQEIYEPRPAVPRPDPGGQYRVNESGRQVRIPARLQVCDLRHLVEFGRRSAARSPISRAPSASPCT